jgi:lipoprotein signal peptidase
LAWLPFVLPLLLILVADRATKWWVRETLWEPPRTVIVVPNWLELTPVANRGIAFGLLQESGGILALVAVVTLGFIALRNWRQVLGAPVLFRIALGLIGGGALGNLIDRVQIGYVTDFIRVPRIALFQVFNIADAAIVVGTVTLVFALWQSEERARRRHSDPAPQADAPGVE